MAALKFVTRKTGNRIGRKGDKIEKARTFLIKTAKGFPIVVAGGKKVTGKPQFYVLLGSKKSYQDLSFRNLEKASWIKVGILDLRIIEISRVKGVKNNDVRWENFPKVKKFLENYLWKKSSFNKKWTNFEYVCWTWNVMNVGTFSGEKQGFKFWKSGNSLPTEIPFDYIPKPRKLLHEFDIDFEDGLWDFTNLVPPESKYKKMVFLTHKREHRKTPFLLVKTKKDYIPVTIEENPRIRFKKKVKIPRFKYLKEWILKKRSVLLNYWKVGADPYRKDSADQIEALDPTWRRKKHVVKT